MKHIGYVAWDDKANAPYQPMLREYSHPRSKPITVYKSEGTAKGYSPNKTAKQVFVAE